MGLYASKPSSVVSRKLSVKKRLAHILTVRSKEARQNSLLLKTSLKTRDALRHKARGKLDTTTLVGRIVVTTHMGFIESLYPRFVVSDNINDYRPEYQGMIYTGEMNDFVMDRLNYVHNYIVLREFLDPDARENIGWVTSFGRHKIVRLSNVRDYIMWFFPKQEKRIGEFRKVYAEQMPQFLNLVLTCIIQGKQLPSRKQTESISPYPLFKIFGKSDWSVFLSTYLQHVESGESWKTDSSLLTFLGRVMDGEVEGNRGGYNQLVKTAHKLYGHRIQKAVAEYAQSPKIPELAMIDLYYAVSGADKALSGISDDCGMQDMELGIFLK